MVTADELATAALAPGDLEPGFTVGADDGGADPVHVARALFGKTGSVPVMVGLELTVGEAAGPALDADRLMALLDDRQISDGMAIEQIEVAMLAPGAVAYTVTGGDTAERAWGSVYGWQQGPIAVMLMVLTWSPGEATPASPAGLRYAELQRDKLAAALATLPS